MTSIPRVLIVEDDDMFITLHTRLLSVWEPSITTAKSAREACDLLSAAEFDLIITDYRLVGGDCQSILDHIRLVKPHLMKRTIVVTAFPTIARSISETAIVDKADLVSIGPLLSSILGQPRSARQGSLVKERPGRPESDTG